MTITDLIATDPEAFRKVLQTPTGTAWHVAGVNRYVVEMATAIHTKATEEDQVPTREVWTNALAVACQLIGAPAPGQQVDLFTEAQAWSNGA